MTYPISFRRHVLGVKEREGLTFLEASERFAVGIASLVRWNKEIEPQVYRRERGLKIVCGCSRLRKVILGHFPGQAYRYRSCVRPHEVWL